MTFTAVCDVDAAASVVTTKQTTVSLETVAEGLDHPWGLTFISQDKWLVSERPGTLRLVEKGKVGPPLNGLPTIDAGGQGGLLDLLYHEPWLYFSFSEPGPNGTNSTAVARGKLNQQQLEAVEIIFRQAPKVKSSVHFGSRLALTKDGYLYITLGDRGSYRDKAQTLDNHFGKVVRIWPDGKIPPDNPYGNNSRNSNQSGHTEKLSEIWSYGHRNIQGAALHPTSNALWIHEHGPKGGDEINIPDAGKNYGWPVITYGNEYSGGKIGEGTQKAGMEQPLYYWVPSIAPSGMTFYTGNLYPQWQGDLFVGSLKFKQLVRLELEGNKIIAEERMFQKAIGERIRHVTQGPDEKLYLLTDSSNGKIIRIDQAPPK